MKFIPGLCALVAVLCVIAAVFYKLTGQAVPFDIAPRGLLIAAAVALLFGINHSLCPCSKKE